jgi:hypothetical protein
MPAFSDTGSFRRVIGWVWRHWGHRECCKLAAVGLEAAPLTIVIEVVGLATADAVPATTIGVGFTGHVASARVQPRIWRLAVLALTWCVAKSARPFSRGPLWEIDRGADRVSFGKLDAAMTQNIVSGRVMKIEVG